MTENLSTACQIYLLAQAGLDPDMLGQALDAGPVAAVLLRSETVPEEDLTKSIECLRPLVQDHEVAFLVENRPQLANEMGCDGVHLSQAKLKVRDARRHVGEDAIVGVSCGLSRHAAIVAGEAGADYVAFGTGAEENWYDAPPDPELLSWWQALMTLPCVAATGRELTSAAAMAAAGADFAAVGPAIWTYPAGPGAAIRDLIALFESRAS